jgi:hypothetical protein
MKFFFLPFLAFSLLLPSSLPFAFAQETAPVANAPAEANAMLTSAPDESSPSKFSHPYYSLTGAISVPQPITLGVQVGWDSVPRLQAFFEGGYFKYSLASGRYISEYSFTTGVHYHPFGKAFYLGGSLGYRHLGLVADISSLKTDTGEVIASDATLALNTFFLGLVVGWEWKWSERLSFGMEIGAQLALLHGGNITILPNPGSTVTDLSVSYEQTTDRLSGFPLPQIALARFIYRL